jgi:hypothetical protein
MDRCGWTGVVAAEMQDSIDQGGDAAECGIARFSQTYQFSTNTVFLLRELFREFQAGKVSAVEFLFGASEVGQMTTTNHQMNVLEAEGGGFWAGSIGILARAKKVKETKC